MSCGPRRERAKVSDAVEIVGTIKTAPQAPTPGRFARANCWRCGEPSQGDAANAPNKAPRPTKLLQFVRSEAGRVDETRAAGGDGGGHRPPAATPDDGGDGPRSHGFSVDALNKEYAVVMVGSQAVVYHEQPHARLIEHQVRMLGIDGFKTWYRNRFTEFRGRDGKIKCATWANAWLDARDRRQYQGVEFFPDPDNAPGTSGYLNLWSGFAVKPAPVPDPKKYKTFRDHLLANVCCGDDKLFQWVFGFFAQIVQRPRERLGIALVMRGKMGTGKTKVGEVIGLAVSAALVSGRHLAT